MMNFVKFNKVLQVVFLGSVGIALGLAGLAFAPTLPLAMCAMALAGVSASMINVQISTIFQNNIPPETLGRAYGLLSALTQGAQPLGYASAGFLLNVMPTRRIFLSMAGLLSLASLTWLRPTVRRHLQKEHEAPPPSQASPFVTQAATDKLGADRG